ARPVAGRLPCRSSRWRAGGRSFRFWPPSGRSPPVTASTSTMSGGRNTCPRLVAINTLGNPMAEHAAVPPSVWRNPWHFLAFGFGSGTLPKAPGTWGSLVALPFVPLWQMLPDWGYWLMLGVTMLLGV